ncbi:hypothetical protein ABZ626_16855 [Streptomyces longispororuber]|uniref:hypothetical protein n=1 Tax=Streptomyces longispororuber TaxID=68230 RepID=UPI003411D076
MVRVVDLRPTVAARTRRAAIATAALSATVLLGCAPTPAPATRPNVLPATPPPFTGRLSASAVDLATHSGTWPATEKLLRTASDALARDCMRTKGFDYPAEPAIAPRAPENETAAVELNDRRRSGYGIASVDPGEKASPKKPVDRYYEKLPEKDRERFDQALFGPPKEKLHISDTGWGVVSVPRKGCLAESEQHLVGDVRLWARITYVAERIDNQLGAAIVRAQEYKAALSIWRSCMAAQGHPYATPESIQPKLRKKHHKVGPTKAFRQHEIDVAVADGKCALKAHLPAVSLRVQRQLVTTLSKSDKKTLAALAFHRDTAVMRSREILDKNR